MQRPEGKQNEPNQRILKDPQVVQQDYSLKFKGGYEAEQIGESQIMKNSIHHIMDFTLYLGGVS